MTTQKIIIACEGIKSEIDYLVSLMASPPRIHYLPQNLHNEPDKLRQTLQEKIDELESGEEDLREIVLGYGLCGRATCGLTSKRVRLVFPRVHDCIPLYLGSSQRDASRDQEDGVLWLTAGMMEYSDFGRHLLYERYQKYAEKFGEAKAAKMIKAENRVFANYKSACHVLWPKLGEEYAPMAKKLAEEINLPYVTRQGDTGYLDNLLRDPTDKTLFLFLEPGDTLEMRSDGEIVAKSELAE